MNDVNKSLCIKINSLINEKKEQLLSKLPSVIEFDDGVICVRFFSEWDICEENIGIRYKQVNNRTRPNEKNYLFYLPKDSYFIMKKRNYIGQITSIEGSLVINNDNSITTLNSYEKISLNSHQFSGKALENTHILTSSSTR